MTVALTAAGGGEFSMASVQVLGHLFFEDSLGAFAYPGLNISLYGGLELSLGQASYFLTQPTNYRTLSPVLHFPVEFGPVGWFAWTVYRADFILITLIPKIWFGETRM